MTRHETSTVEPACAEPNGKTSRFPASGADCRGAASTLAPDKNKRSETLQEAPGRENTGD